RAWGDSMLGNGKKPLASLVAAWLVAALACAALAATPARADGENRAPPPSASGWTFDFTPYGWVTWLKGEETVRGRTVDVDVDPIQLIDHLEQVPFMGYSELRNGPLGFYGDIVY